MTSHFQGVAPPILRGWLNHEPGLLYMEKQHERWGKNVKICQALLITMTLSSSSVSALRAAF
jgi:hypothetical protein